MQEYGSQQYRVDDHNMVYSQGRDPNGIIMVESNPHGAYKQQQQQQQVQPENVAASTTSNGKKKKNKKNKNKIGDDASNKSNQMQTMGGDRMVSFDYV
jgi:hypothetical protein